MLHYVVHKLIFLIIICTIVHVHVHVLFYLVESFLEIHNPYPVVINWRLSSAVPSFVKEVLMSIKYQL